MESNKSAATKIGPTAASRAKANNANAQIVKPRAADRIAITIKTRQ
ncbi:Uncharacterised protein [Mycobacterium tuberculosis]|nr:Uncharacterised protein [Mycobacterium tuberculosis]